MAHAILMPRFGQMSETGILTAWHKQEGDPVHPGDVLFEIETEKSAMEVEAFDEGVLIRRLVDEGAEVPVNTVCGYIGEPGESVPELPEPPVADAAGMPTQAAAAAVATPITETGEPAGPPPASEGAAQRPGVAGGGRLRVSPRAMRLAAEAGLDPATITGTGPDGRIVERDVQAAAAARTVPAVADGLAASAPTRSTLPQPTGPSPAVGAPEPGPDGEEPPRPLSRMRRVIADRMTLSATTIPTYRVTVAVDVTGLLALRRELGEAGRELTVTDFILSATAQALVEFPDLNARTDGVSLWPRRRIHLGLAVSLPDGLLVPVIRDADRLSVDGIHVAVERLATAARDRRLGPDELSGSTFTVSNLGMFGVDEFSAIINPGESGILAVGSAVATPVVLDGGIAVRSIMKLTLTADHRLVDGEQGARFLNAIRRRLEDHRTFRRELGAG